VKKRWEKLAERIDNASLRERALIFATLALLLVFVMDAAFISGESARERRLSKDIAQRQTEMKAVQEQLQKMARARGRDPDVDKRTRLNAVKGEIAKLESAIAEEQRKFTDPAQMRVVLQELLDRGHGVKLVDFKTLPAASITEARGAQGADKPAAEKPAAKPAAGAERFVYRHEFELTVSGTYAELHRYLTELEKLPTRLHWGVAELTTTKHPQLTLKLTVHTLSLDKAWLSA
jgi:MSHA biogenesis protein MshJ